MKRIPSNQTNNLIRRERDQRAFWRLGLLLLSGILLASGFVFAAGQHFAALRYGYQREDLRNEKSRLLDEQHRLLLAREEAGSPRNLEGAARSIGLQPIRPAQISKAKMEIATEHSIGALAISSATVRR